jgi:hypothetical protein
MCVVGFNELLPQKKELISEIYIVKLCGGDFTMW